MSAFGMEVKGLLDLERWMKAAPEKIDKGLRKELRAAMKPIQADAHTFAVGAITNIGGPWSKFRIGIAGGGTTVYLAPQKRGSKNPALKRGNLAPLLLHDAMEPAVDRNGAEAVRKVEDMIERVLSE